MWGKVIIHGRGYRAELAYPQELLVPRGDFDAATATLIDAAIRRYGVAVRWLDEPVLPPLGPQIRPQPIRSQPIAPRCCDVCRTDTIRGKKCTNVDHDWAAHKKWKAERKATGQLTLLDLLDDVIDPPPRKGQTREQAESSLLNRVIRGVSMTVILGGIPAANVAWSALERMLL